MRRLIPALLAVACLSFLAGCADHSDEIDELKGLIATQQTELDSVREDFETETDKLRKEIERLRAQLGDTPEGAEAVSLAERLKVLQERLAEVEKGSEAEGELAAEVAALKKKFESVKTEAIKAAELVAAKTVGNLDEERLAELIAEKTAEAAVRNAPTKDLATALGRLEISDAEKDAIRTHVIDAKRERLELLEIETADGRVFAEEVIDIFIGPGEQADKHGKIIKIFMELMTTKVPGDAQDRTYAEALEEIKRNNRENIGRILSDEDRRTLSNAHEDWTEFEVGGDDPWGELAAERMDKMKKAAEEEE